jgi:hypothetical protein
VDPDVEALIEEIERAFGVQLNRQKLSDETTIQGLQDFVVATLAQATTHRCWSSIVFWRFRRALVEELALPRSAVVPSAFLEDLIPRRIRRGTWKRLSARLRLKLPALEYPRSLDTLFFFIALLPLVWGLLAHLGLWCILLTLLIPVLATLLVKIAAPLATEFPSSSQTVRDLIRTVVGLNYSALETQFGPAHEHEVRESVKRIILNLTGAECGWVSDETNLLGLIEATGGFRVGA